MTDTWQTRIKAFPQVRYMGSKARLLPWIAETVADLPFASALDAFSGSGSVAFLLKALGKRVVTNDFLQFPTTLATAIVENSLASIPEDTLAFLLEEDRAAPDFIEKTFGGIFYTLPDLRFLDSVSHRIRQLEDPQ